MEAAQFLEQYQQTDFKYKEELTEGLSNGSWRLGSFTGGDINKMTATAFVTIYGKKAANLNQKKDVYSKHLQDDLIDLCKTLEPHGESIIDVWSFTDDTSFINIFILREKNTVLCSVKTQS